MLFLSTEGAVRMALSANIICTKLWFDYFYDFVNEQEVKVHSWKLRTAGIPVRDTIHLEMLVINNILLYFSANGA
jgi:hypothetical protein